MLLKDNDFGLVSSGDDTKIVLFDVSGMETNSILTIAIPSYTYAGAGTLVFANTDNNFSGLNIFSDDVEFAANVLVSGAEFRLGVGSSLVFDGGTGEYSIIASATASAIALTLPSATGTLALTSDISALSSVYQPLDTDLTEIAGLANVRGDTIITNSSANWVRLPVGAAGSYLSADGTDVAWALLDAIRTWTTLQTFKTNAITIVDATTVSKALIFQLSGATAAKTLTLASAHTNNRTVTFPDATCTLTSATLGNTWTQTQIFAAAVAMIDGTSGFQLSNVADNTKSATFDLSLITTGTNRALKWPDQAGTIAVTSDIPTIDAARTWASLQKFKDTTFLVGDDGDITKALIFSLGGATTGKTLTLLSSHTNDRTITFPDVTDTLVGKTTTDTLSNKTLDNTTILTIKDANLSITDDADTTKLLAIQLSGSATGRTTTLAFLTATSNKTLTFPNVTATLAHIGATAQTFAGSITFNGAFTSTAGFTTTGSASFNGSTGASILDPGSGSGPNIIATASAANASNFTLPDLPAASSFILKTGTDANSTSGAGAAIGSTTLATTPNAGLYAIFWDLYCTTAGTAGTATVTFSWTDDIGATSYTSVTLSMATTGRFPVGTNSPIVFRVASGNVTFNTTVAGVVGSPVHKLYARLVAL